MTLTRRGKLAAALVAVLVIGAGAAGAFLLLGKDQTSAVTARGSEQTEESPPAEETSPPPPPEPCPLTGVVPEAGVPDRPALAVKVEESPDARPQAGLLSADIVYEQPVEGGITRLVAVFHCSDAERVGPVRSARFMDANLLPQFGTPLFGYSGGAPETKALVRAADLVDLTFEGAAMDAYVRDPNRSMPHDVFTTTDALYEAGGDEGGRPQPVFSYSRHIARGTAAESVHIPFNPSLTADVYWRWIKSEKHWLRFLGSDPEVDESGAQLSAINVVIQVVELRDTGIVDAAGTRSPEVIVIGSGPAIVFRNGKMIEGTWEKESAEAITRFVGPNGKRIPLAPGNTWVELIPTNVQIEIA